MYIKKCTGLQIIKKALFFYDPIKIVAENTIYRYNFVETVFFLSRFHSAAPVLM